MKSFRDILAPLILAPVMLAGAAALCGCSSRDDFAEPRGNTATSPDGNTYLLLNTGIIERADAETAGAVPSRELINTLRVILVGDGGNVEYNELADYANQPRAGVYRVFRTTPGHKTIYLIANEAGAGPSLAPALKPFDAKALEAYSFSNEGSSEALPASAKYEFDIAETDRGKRVEKVFNLVRAATKFQFRFKNYRSDTVRVNSVEVSALASGMYLMPRVGDADLVKNFGDTPLHWAEWLRLVAEESQADLRYPPADYTLTNLRGWIKAYDLPAAATHRARPIDLAGLPVPRLMKEEDLPVVSPAFYFNESRNAAASDGTQAYRMTFHLTQGEQQVTLTRDFPNLEALFRNTHVLVDVEFSSEIIIKVIPYAECVLEPVFGLNRKETN